MPQPNLLCLKFRVSLMPTGCSRKYLKELSFVFRDSWFMLKGKVNCLVQLKRITSIRTWESRAEPGFTVREAILGIGASICDWWRGSTAAAVERGEADKGRVEAARDKFEQAERETKMEVFKWKKKDKQLPLQGLGHGIVRWGVGQEQLLYHVSYALFLFSF